VRKRAEGFDYNAVAPGREERGRGERRFSQPKMEPKLPGNSPRGSGDARPNGQRRGAVPSPRRSWGRSRSR
jgi:hypothetical protein